MEVAQFGAAEKPPPMTYDEVSMERSKSFVKALQVLLSLFFFCISPIVLIRSGFTT